jgi:hypothetical protein
MSKNIILSVIVILVFVGAMLLLSNKKDKVKLKRDKFIYEKKLDFINFISISFIY